MASTITKNFTAVGTGNSVSLHPGEEVTYTVAGTFVGTWILQRSENGVAWVNIATGTGTTSTPYKNDENGSVKVRFECSVYTSGTMSTTIAESTAETQKDVLGPDGVQIWKVTEDGMTVTGNVTATGTVSSAAGVALANVVEDTTPQLGGTLDASGQNITDTTQDLALIANNDPNKGWYIGATTVAGAFDDGAGKDSGMEFADGTIQIFSNNSGGGASSLTQGNLNQKMVFTGALGAVNLRLENGGIILDGAGNRTLRIPVRTTANRPAAPVDGDMGYNSTTNKFEAYQNGGWVDMLLATPVAVADGGTGQTTKTEGFDALSPTTTKGDIIASNGTDNVRRAVGADGQVLTADSAEADGVKWAAAPGGGETNTASNVGTGGVGVFKQKTGVDLEMKKINAGSSKVTITDDVANSEVDIDVTEANLTLDNLGGTLAITKGGTGATTQQAALDAIGGAVTSGQFIRGDGVNLGVAAIQAGDVPTLNQNTTGTASNVTGTVAIANGGSGATTKTAAFDALSPVTTQGDIIYRDASNNVRLAAGGAGRKLAMNGAATAPAWVDDIRTINATLYEGGSVLAVGNKMFVRSPYAGTIVKASLLAGASGNLIVDIRKSTYAAWTGIASGTTITASATPTLTGATKYEDATLTGWTTAITAGDILVFEVKATPATIVRATLALDIRIS